MISVNRKDGSGQSLPAPEGGSGKTSRILTNPGLWLIVAVLVLLTIPHYAESLKHPTFLNQIMADIGLTRHALERILFLAPIVWAGFIFGWKGSFAVSIVAVVIMLPRAIIFSDYRIDAYFETGAVFIIGNVLSISFAGLRREREYRQRLEVTQQQLKTSEERYRQLFENAHDGIWIHDLEGNIITANRAAEKMTGYNAAELTRMNVKSFLSPESLELAQRIRRKMMNNEPVVQPYEQRIIRRDGSEVIMQLSTSPVQEKGVTVAFQHIARDITEQKRMEQNLRYYLQQATRAQEEERKRISHELHDDTIQALVVLARQLDALASEAKDLPPGIQHRLEELWQQTDSILQGVRRLSQDLRPAAIDRLGLLPAVRWLAAEVSKQSGIIASVEVIGQERRLPEEAAVALFRIIQEALRNVWKHSGANTVKITIEFSETHTRAIVSDNGRGFKLAGEPGDLTRHGKLGMVGMQERAQLVGGTFTISSEPGKGTTIVVDIPS